MNENIYTSIDIGSRNLKFMTLEFNPENNKTKILHKNSYPSRGVTNGYIANINIFNQSFYEALKKYHKETGILIKEAIFNINSFGLKSKILKISHNTLNQSSVTDVDLNEIERKIKLIGDKNIDDYILDLRPIKYTINNYEYFSDIEGLNAKKIEVEYIFIYLPKNHISILEKISEKNDISILNFIPGNVASAEISLDKLDKDLGVLNIDFGASLTMLSIWENNKLVFLNSINFGSDDITKKISLENKISFNEAEKLKRNWGENKKIEKIIKNSFDELSEKIKNILISLKKNELLPAGIVIYGGGSKNIFLDNLLKNKLMLPVKKYKKNISDSVTDYQNNYGIIIYEILNNQNKSFKLPNFSKWFKKIFSGLEK